jgi:hypothetical protein
MEIVKKFGLPAVLSYFGFRASAVLGTTNTIVQIGAGVLGGFLGLVVADKIKG